MLFPCVGQPETKVNMTDLNLFRYSEIHITEVTQVEIKNIDNSKCQQTKLRWILIDMRQIKMYFQSTSD